jgi:hypothetical protein
VGVDVQRMMVHGQQAEQVIVVLGDCFAGPVPVHRADLELLEVPTELHLDPFPWLAAEFTGW